MTGLRVDLLAGVRVAEVSCSLRGAFAGKCFHGLGAAVTRVDLGLRRRGVPPSCDWGKTTTTSSQPALPAALAGMDLVIEDLDDPVVVEAVASLADPPVLVSVTGLGRDQGVPNPPELVVQAHSGVLWSTGAPGGSPSPVPAGLPSTLAAVHAASAGLWCLWQRATKPADQAPRHVDVSEADLVLAQTGTYRIFLRYYGGSWTEQSRPGGRGIGSTLMLGEIVDAADGPIYLQIANQRQLCRLHKLLGSEFADRFPTYRECLIARDGYRRYLERFAAGRTRAELLELSMTGDLVAAPFLSFDDLGPDGLLPLIMPGADEAGGALPLPWLIEIPEVASR
jgi:crotonobetainyl-CoA:carnitine CoA-transferase CaiB-like acyl-CoA transferase